MTALEEPNKEADVQEPRRGGGENVSAKYLSPG